ncbi:aminopeptidase N [Saccharopolyspora lacisalsi]|uniref:Aminopeptidase N n=1 Tax=Halosaccharopolyspora lacisalsi TaxID=1000566 RepID=A0A839DYR9_9PSEU|nr:M1 family metallopeptidase [Halosaccharopolyspora lacisalsi]MBA8827112.1 aminopeptidase N [Halosaccharopolyspora lacisalsi]
MTRRNGRRRAAVVTGSVLSSIALTAGTALAAGAGAPGAGDPYYPTDGNGGYDVADYNVDITYDPASKHLDGTTTVTATSLKNLGRFNLDLHKLHVDRVTVNGTKAEFDRAREHELVITPNKPLPPDKKFTVTVRYSGTPGPIVDPVGKGGWQTTQSGGAFTAGEPHSATTWFPANDHPSDKATFHLTATVPQGWKVVSNGTRREVGTRDGWTTARWAAEKPMATYLTTIGIDEWTIERSKLADGTPVVNAYAPGAEGAREKERRLPEILNFLESKFGEYPFASAGGIFLAKPISFSLETQTRPIYTKGVPLSTIVHEQAHQWYGDSVSVREWRDICLNECFASYATWMWSEAKEGQNLDQRYREAVHSVDQEFWNRKLVDMGAGNEFTAVYDKGQLALHALRNRIGDRAFDEILKTWPARHRDGNASWEEFESLTEKISGQHLDGFFRAWFHGDTKPAGKYLWPGGLHP